MRIRCTHRYKGLNGQYVFRLRVTRDSYLLTEHQCQIKGCKHWRVGFKNKLSKKESTIMRRRKPITKNDKGDAE